MRVYFFDEWSNPISPRDTGWKAEHIPLPNEIVIINKTSYVCLRRSFHFNSHGEHEVYLTLKPI